MDILPGVLSIWSVSNVRRISTSSPKPRLTIGAVTTSPQYDSLGAVENRAMSRHPRTKATVRTAKRAIPSRCEGRWRQRFPIIGKNRGRGALWQESVAGARRLFRSLRGARRASPRGRLWPRRAWRPHEPGRTYPRARRAKGPGRLRRLPGRQSVRAPRPPERGATTMGSVARATRSLAYDRSGWRRPPPPTPRPAAPSRRDRDSADATAASRLIFFALGEKLDGPSAHLGRRVTLERNEGRDDRDGDRFGCVFGSETQIGGAVSIPSVKGANAGFPSRARRASATARARSMVVVVEASAARRKVALAETKAFARSLAV